LLIIYSTFVAYTRVGRECHLHCVGSNFPATAHQDQTVCSPTEISFLVTKTATARAPLDSCKASGLLCCNS